MLPPTVACEHPRPNLIDWPIYAGHTLTALAGPEGDLQGARLVLFGGATALEGSQKNDGAPPASPGPASGTGLLSKPTAKGGWWTIIGN